MCGSSCNDAGRAGKAPVSSPGLDGQLRVVLQVWSKSSQVCEEAWRTVCFGHPGTKSMHEAHACCRAAGIPRKIAFLDHRSCSRRKHGQGGGKATEGTTMTGWAGRAGTNSNSAPHGRSAADESRRQETPTAVRRSQMVLEMWSSRRTEQRAEIVAENRMQRCSPYQGVRESTFLARQRATSQDLRRRMGPKA